MSTDYTVNLLRALHAKKLNRRSMLAAAAMMPAAKARNDIDTFSKTTYTVLGDGVKIQSLRHSTLKNYDSWLVLLLRKEKGGMKIYQELSQSRP